MAILYGLIILTFVCFLLHCVRRKLRKRKQNNAALPEVHFKRIGGIGANNIFNEHPIIEISKQKKENSLLELNVQCLGNLNEVHDLKKASGICHMSDRNGQFIERSTQTRRSFGSETNVFGRNWDGKCSITKIGGMWTLVDSDVKVTFSVESLKCNTTEFIDVHGSVFTDLTEIRGKFEIPEDNDIVAPVVEFSSSQEGLLPDYAVVEIPHSMKTNLDKLLVQWFPSKNKSTGRLALQDVPRKSEDSDQDMYFEISKNGALRIYTKHFSGFVCSVCKAQRNITICATIFGSYTFIKNEEWNVDLRVYLSDDNIQLRDFQKVYVM